MTTFKELAIGDTFDWAKPDSRANSFFRPCMKVSARRYRTIDGGPIEYLTVGSVRAEVSNVNAYVYDPD
jgi:hypothetical protein